MNSPIFFQRCRSQTSKTLEGRVSSRKLPRPQPQRHYNELLRRSANPTPEQTNTSTSTSTTHSPPPESTCYASLTNVSLNDCIGEEDCSSTKYIIVDQNGKAEASQFIQTTSSKSKRLSPVNSDRYKGTTVRYCIIDASASSETLQIECPKTDEPMEPNSLPPSAPPYNASLSSGNQVHYSQIPVYEYVQPGDGSQPHYQVEQVHYEQHPGTQSYYVTTAGYNSAEYSVVPDTRYVIEQPQASYYPNGYVQPSTSNAYNGPPSHVAYPPQGASSGLVYSNTYDQRSQPLNQRHFVDQKGYPIGSRSVVQIVDMSKTSTQPLPSTVLSDPSGSVSKAQSKSAKKRAMPVPTHTITSIPIDADNKVDSKKQFKCMDCGKCVSSARNLTRHRDSCKVKKQKSVENAALSVQSKSSNSSLGSPSKSKLSNTKQSPQISQPSSAHSESQSSTRQSYQTFVSADGIPPNVIYHGPPPPHHHAYTTHYPPHTALPHSNSQPIFDYPSSGLPSGLHSAPPTMSNYQPPLTPLQSYVQPSSSSQNQPTYDSQRTIDYVNEYAYTTPMDSFIENAIDEMAHNPLAFIGSGEYEGGNSAERSLHDNPEFAGMHQTTIRNGPLPPQVQQPKTLPIGQLASNTAGPSNEQKAKNGRKSGERKNTVPTPHRCDACQKYMCSQRSLRRHKSTCKLYLKTAPELSVDEKQLIAKNEENRCENCGKILQSSSNLRRHRNGCKQKSEDESKPPLSTTMQPNNSPTHNPTIVAHLASQVITAVDPNTSAKRLMMPPPEAQESAPGSSHQYQQPEGVQKYTTSLAPPSGISPTAVIFVKNEEGMTYQSQAAYMDAVEKSAPNLTVGEHLRHCYNKPTSIPPVVKQQVRRPPILGRKSSLQHTELSLRLEEPPATCPPPAAQVLSPPGDEFHSRSAPPIDLSPKMTMKLEPKFESEEAIRKSEQVADVINSVVEKIRRQNVADQQQQFETLVSKRPSNTPVAGQSMPKMSKVEQSPKPTIRPLTCNISTQPITANSVAHLASPRLEPVTIQQPMIQQRAVHSAPTTLQSSQIQVPLVAAEQESNDESKVVARYMCPECLKFYACRKNVRTHRMNTHSLTEEQADANVAKRVKVQADSGFILTPGFDHENSLLQQRSSTESIKPTVVKTAGQPKKRNSTASNGDNKPRKSPAKLPSLPMPNGQPHTSDRVSPQISTAHYYMTNNSNGLHPTTISPQYEQLQPVPIDTYISQQHVYAPSMSQPHQTIYDSDFIPNDHLEIWNEIKTRVDDPYLSTRDDEIDVARIAADLKRSAESEMQQQPSQAQKMTISNGNDFHSMILDPKSNPPPVERVEADTTFHDDNEADEANAVNSTFSDLHYSASRELPEEGGDQMRTSPTAHQSFGTDLGALDSSNSVEIEFGS